ncbi:MAG: tetratricopeptide repeat protein, partial [bacterium]|nr:tetratricopeptide repeat protein [bacterium]
GYFTTGRNYERMEDYEKADENYEKALVLRDRLGLSGFTYYKDNLERARKKIKK